MNALCIAYRNTFTEIAISCVNRTRNTIKLCMHVGYSTFLLSNAVNLLHSNRFSFIGLYVEFFFFISYISFRIYIYILLYMNFHMHLFQDHIFALTIPERYRIISKLIYKCRPEHLFSYIPYIPGRISFSVSSVDSCWTAYSVFD